MMELCEQLSKQWLFWFILGGMWMCGQNFMTINLIVVLFLHFTLNQKCQAGGKVRGLHHIHKDSSSGNHKCLCQISSNPIVVR